MRRLCVLAVAALLSGCTFGPDYKRPSAPVSAAYQEPVVWKTASPRPAASEQTWWAIFNDPVLDALERQVAVSNQTLKANEAAIRQARALVRETRAGFYPTLSAGAGVTRSGSGARSGGSSGSGGAVGGARARTQFSLSADVNWDLDLWGRIRRSVESDVAAAQASEADLAAARLSFQAELASDYFSLRALDAQRQLLDQAVAAYQESLRIAGNQYRAGIVARGDVVTAETQLRQTQAQAIATGIQRAQFAHAIAVLIGKPPAEVTVATATLPTAVPVVPAGVPSELLERRPDVAAAERRVASANAQIGVAEAAYFPDVTLSGSVGYASAVLGNLVQAASRAWSLGANLAQLVFDGGAREARVAEARAAYDQTVADYRQTALNAFQEVEDQLAALRLLEAQADIQQQAVLSAREAQRLELNQYRAGTVAYTSVVTAQQIALSNEQTALSIQESRLLASVGLVQALGGGWREPEAQTGSASASPDLLPSGFRLP